MAVISISITESSDQVVAGIPKIVSLETNIPATIFYTLDGSDPTTSSSVYVGPVTLPTDIPTVVFKFYATNGTDSSVIITKTYSPSFVGDRRPHSTVTGLTPGIGRPDPFPFGDNGPFNTAKYGNAGGITVDAAGVTNIPDGYDGSGNTANGTDLPITSYQFVYSTTNAIGEMGHGIGTFPGKTTIIVPTPTSPSSSSKTSDKFFNPRAMVIYQDSREPTYDDVPMLNRASFSLQDLERDKNGSLLMNTAFDSSTPSGSFLRQHYNPKDNTTTYYYRDSDTGRWIISVEPFSPRNSNIGALYNVVFTAQPGSQFIFKWIPFMSRKLI